MIQANELRIGNYVNYNDGSGNDDIRQVVGIDKNSITSVVKGCHFATAVKSNDLVYAIPLTEEILLKCGFEQGCYGFKKGVLMFRYRFDGKFIPVVSNQLLHEVKHLHQLQNIYFALTGEELEIKL